MKEEDTNAKKYQKTKFEKQRNNAYSLSYNYSGVNNISININSNVKTEIMEL